MDVQTRYGMKISSMPSHHSLRLPNTVCPYNENTFGVSGMRVCDRLGSVNTFSLGKLKRGRTWYVNEKIPELEVPLVVLKK